MYQASKQCQEEVQFSKQGKIPIIPCCLLPNWKPSGSSYRDLFLWDLSAATGIYFFGIYWDFLINPHTF
jgi:hypothetical protein